MPLLRGLSLEGRLQGIRGDRSNHGMVRGNRDFLRSEGILPSIEIREGTIRKHLISLNLEISLMEALSAPQYGTPPTNEELRTSPWAGSDCSMEDQRSITGNSTRLNRCSSWWMSIWLTCIRVAVAMGSPVFGLGSSTGNSVPETVTRSTLPAARVCPT